MFALQQVMQAFVEEAVDHQTAHAEVSNGGVAIGDGNDVGTGSVRSAGEG